MTMAPQRSRPSRSNASVSTWLKICSCLPFVILSACHVTQLIGGNNVVVVSAASSSASSSPSSIANQINLDRRRRQLNTLGSSGNPLFLVGKSDIIRREAFLPQLVRSIRGGATDDDSDSESESEYDDESSDDEYDDEEESDSEGEEEIEVEDSEEEESDSDNEYDEEEEEDEENSSNLASYSKDMDDIEYDAMLTPPAMQQFSVSIGVMLLSNRIDILDHKAVKIARFAFLAYLICTQAFLIYVRIRAKQMNDRTPITINNPLASLVQGSAAAGGGNAIVKSLADQVLSTQTTILEYDLKEVKKMNGSLLFPMVFLYFLHFRMKQVQPLIMQTATGFLNLVYSPLFQVYVLGRNLERPFKPPGNPMLGNMEEMQSTGEVEGEEEVQSGESAASEEEAEEEDADESGGEEEDDDESEYDSDEE